MRRVKVADGPAHGLADAALERGRVAVDDLPLGVGFGRIVISEKEVPNMLVNLV